MRGSRNCFQGGPGLTSRKQSEQGFFSPQLILQFTEGVQWFYNRENYSYEGSRGGPTFSMGGPTFSTGVQMLISIEIHITCDFPGGGGGGGVGPPIPPLDPRLT